MMHFNPGEQKREHHELNRQQLAVLQRNGSDLSKTHTTCHHFEAHDDSAVGMLRSILKASGFHVMKVSKIAEGTPFDFCWKLEAELKMIPMLPSLHAMTDYCIEMANMAGGEYKGWYAEAVPPKQF